MMSRYFKLILLLCACMYGSVISALPSKITERENKRKAAIAHHYHTLADSIKALVEPQVFTPGYADSLLVQIEHLHTTLNEIDNEAKYGFKTKEVRLQLAQMQGYLQIISRSMSRDSTVTSIKNLQMFSGLLKDMAEKLMGWRELLYKDNKELQQMSKEMQAFEEDSLIQKVASDTAFANLHLEEIIILNERWTEAEKITQAKIKKIAKLQSLVSTSYFDVTELQNKVENDLTGLGPKTFAPEYDFIWNALNPYSLDDVMAYTAQSFQERMSMLGYYLTLNPVVYLSVILIGLFFFIWVFLNFRKIKAYTTDENRSELSFQYILPVPILSTLILILNIAPFYGWGQPALYIEILHLLILIPLTVVIIRIWPRDMIVSWIIMAMLSVLASVMNAIITPGWPLRYFLLGLNVVSALNGLNFFLHYKKHKELDVAVKWVSVLYILMNLLAIAANTTGRLTLAKILTSSATAGITEIIGLFVLVHILIEAFYIQMKRRRINSSMPLKFNFDDIRDGLFRVFSVIAVFFWLINFATNLEIYGTVLSFLDAVFNTPRHVGSTVFSYGNIVTFFFVLYVVNILQKYVGYFFGETDDDFIGDLDKKESRLVIFRLVIILLGFFVAVVASGLPVDKVTVVLGALGVGIGLGLQNIVYNLMSGVILIFEKPMKIGDYIEVADKKGRVQNIGIRASKLITSDGSEVIVPNGDILSSHMVNWTRSNNNRRTQMSIKIQPTSELQTARDIIMEEMKHSPFVIQERPVEILLKDLTDASGEVSINVWINSIYKEQQFKSEVLASIYNKLAEKGIKIL